MRTSTRLLIGLAVAGCVAAAGSAFTADLTFGTDEVAQDGEILAYGAASVSGATVKNIAYNVSSTNTSQLSNITFQVLERVDDQGNRRYSAVMSITSPAGVTGPQTTCTRTWVANPNPGYTSIVCTPASAQSVSGVGSVQLAISPV